MFILIRLFFFGLIFAALWLWQPPSLKQNDPMQQIAQQNIPSHEQQIIRPSYQISEQGCIWHLSAEKAVIQQHTLHFDKPLLQSEDGRIFYAAEGLWSFDAKKIYFTGPISIVDASKNISMGAKSAYYDLALKEFIFDDAIEGRYQDS